MIYNMGMYLSLCLIAKDENGYLPEWLDYHILLGVEHFWIYDNESAIPLTETLKEYVDAGWVTINTIQGRAMQLHAYDHCLRTYTGITKWIGFIDTDEFIVLHCTDPLTTFLQKFESYGGLAVSSLFFGHGGNKNRPSGGQIAGYRMRTPEEFPYNLLQKMIVQPQAVIQPVSPHSFLFKEGYYCVNEDMDRVDAQKFPCHVQAIQLNHYFTRSEEEWDQKLSRGRGDSGKAYKDIRGENVNKYSSVEDISIINYLRNHLADTPRDNHFELKKVKPNSRYLSDLLHREAIKRSPSPGTNFKPVEVLPRPELIAYYDEQELGIKLYDAGNYEAFRNLLASQIKMYPFDPIRYINYADASMQMKDFQSAWHALAQAWRIAPRSYYVLATMSEYFYAIGDFSQTEKIIHLAGEKGDLIPENTIMLALCQWKQGKEDEARKTAASLLAVMTPELASHHPHFKELYRLIQPKI